MRHAPEFGLATCNRAYLPTARQYPIWSEIWRLLLILLFMGACVARAPEYERLNCADYWYGEGEQTIKLDHRRHGVCTYSVYNWIRVFCETQANMIFRQRANIPYDSPFYCPVRLLYSVRVRFVADSLGKNSNLGCLLVRRGARKQL